MPEKMTQYDIDNLADIIWWIKGYHAADQPGCPFTDDHMEALRKSRIILSKQIKEHNNDND